MKVVVCVKHIPDAAIVKFDIRTNDLTNTQYILDPIDEISVSEAIKIRNKHSGTITAVTLGPPHAQEALRTCYKMGVDNVIHLCDESFHNIDYLRTATILAKHISTLPYDVILCGQQSMDQGNGFTGIAIAEILGIPVTTSVTRIDVFPDTNTATVHRRLKGGDREIIETPLPAVLTIDSVITKPIYPRLRTILTGLKQDIIIVDAKSLGIDLKNVDPVLDIRGISQLKPRLKKTATIDSSLSPAERMKLIISGGVSEKGTKTIEKSPSESAAEIIQFMIMNGIISKQNQ